MTGDTYSMQTIRVPLEAGSRVTLLDDVSVEENARGSAGTIMFEDYVERYSPDTLLLEFRDSDVGLQEFDDMIRDADSIEIIRNP